MKRQRPGKKLVIGVTGGLGSGKSTVAACFRALGACVVDADLIARRLLAPGTRVSARVIRAFGPGVRGPRGAIDRRRLAQIVFKSRAARARLEAIMHPEIIRSMHRAIRQASGPLVVVDAPLLFEAGCERFCDRVVVVTARLAERIARIRKRDSLSARECFARIRAQMPLSEKLRRADFVIDNNVSKEAVRRQVALLRRNVWKS